MPTTEHDAAPLLTDPTDRFTHRRLLAIQDEQAFDPTALYSDGGEPDDEEDDLLGDEDEDDEDYLDDDEDDDDYLDDEDEEDDDLFDDDDDDDDFFDDEDDD